MAVQDELRRIYRDPADQGDLGGIDRLLRRAQQHYVPGVNRHVVEQFLKGEQAYTLHRPARRRYVRNRSTWRVLKASNRPTWLSCRQSLAKTRARDIYLP